MSIVWMEEWTGTLCALYIVQRLPFSRHRDPTLCLLSDLVHFDHIAFTIFGYDIDVPRVLVPSWRVDFVLKVCRATILI
jgi:hypothetical protein